jgi:hypothetical protein
LLPGCSTHSLERKTNLNACRRKLRAAIASLDAVTDDSGVLLDAARASLLGAGCRIKTEEDALVSMLMSRDEPIELQPNPYNPYLIDPAELLKTHPAASAAGDAGARDDARWGDDAEQEMQRRTGGHEDGDAMGTPARHNSSAAPGPGVASSTGTAVSVRSLAEVDAQLMDLALDHDWDESCSLADFPSLGSASARSLRASVAAATRGMHLAAISAAGSIQLGSGSFGPSSSLAPSSAGGSVFGSVATQRNVQRLPAIPERGVVSSSEAAASGSEAGTAASSQLCKKPSRHDSTDYLRPMREQRELETLCAPAHLGDFTNPDVCNWTCLDIIWDALTGSEHWRWHLVLVLMSTVHAGT